MPSRRELRLTIPIVGALTTLLHAGSMVAQSHAQSTFQSAWSAALRACAFSTACAAGRLSSCCCTTSLSTACRFFESRLSSFLGWISFPLYLVQAAAIYVLAPRGLALLASHGFAPEMQRWLLDFALIPVVLLLAIAFCPINDFAMAASRRFGASVVAFCDDLGARWARRSEPGRAAGI
jgi:peptidoglycan/LPS O-acetylase OafA/YrhL